MSLRVALLNPDTNRKKTQGWMHRFSEAVPPLGLAYLAGVVRQEDGIPRVWDQFATRVSDGDIVARIASFAPDVVAISALTPTMRRAARLVPMIRSACPGVLVVMGNVHATVFPEAVLAEGVADVAVRGEGEETFREILRRYAAKDDLAGVPGTVVMVGDETVYGPDRPDMPNLDAVPRPAWEDCDLTPYVGATLLGVRERMIPVQQSRGCAYRCTFCGQESMHPKVRRRSIGGVVDEIEYFHRRLGIDWFGFLDAYFPVTKRDGLQFCEEMMRRGLHERVSWITETRVDKVDRELLTAMKASGCHCIMYGFEVGDQSIMESIDKKTTVAQNLEAMRLTKELRMLTLGLFVVGLPGETAETIRKTIDHAIELDCDMAKFNIAAPLPGSRFFDDLARDRPELRDEDPEKFSSWFDGGDGDSVLFAPEGMTSQQVLRLQREAMLRFYARPSMVLRHVRNGTIAPRRMVLGAAVLAGNGVKALGPRLRSLL